ncbi:MAG TPA: hypothetical protein VH306_00370 [Gaiellaceae bacterium]|jgi:hypothetical protein
MSAAETPDPRAEAEAAALSAHGLRLEGTPAPAAGSSEDEWDQENFFRVILNLEGGDWVEAATFGDEESAEACARELVQQLAERGAWPRVRSRYLRPETILSVEVSERRRYTGSSVRAAWASSG